jgi:hypothetical protein
MKTKRMKRKALKESMPRAHHVPRAVVKASVKPVVAILTSRNPPRT